MVTFIRFGKKRRLDLMFEWLTLWPTGAVSPVIAPRGDGASLGRSCPPADDAERGNRGSFGSRTYNDRRRGRQVRDRTPGQASVEMPLRPRRRKISVF